MSLFWKLINSLIFTAITLPLLMIGFIAALVWCGLQCGWFWGHRWVEWSFDERDGFTWTAKASQSQRGGD